MNLLNIAVLLREVPLSKTNLKDIILNTVNEILPEEYKLLEEYDGFDIETLYHQLPDDLRKALDVTSVINAMQTQVLISDITLVRNKSEFRQKVADKKPNAFIGLVALVMVVIVSYEIFLLVALITDKNGKVEGIMYDFVKTAVKIISTIVSFF